MLFRSCPITPLPSNLTCVAVNVNFSDRLYAVITPGSDYAYIDMTQANKGTAHYKVSNNISNLGRCSGILVDVYSNNVSGTFRVVVTFANGDGLMVLQSTTFPNYGIKKNIDFTKIPYTPSVREEII